MDTLGHVRLAAAVPASIILPTAFAVLVAAYAFSFPMEKHVNGEVWVAWQWHRGWACSSLRCGLPAVPGQFETLRGGGSEL